jgi:SsrA-binding protein
MSHDNVNIKNKKASFEYEFLDVFMAGIQLTGTEIKSIRDSKSSIQEAYCIIMHSELFIKNMHIAEYDNGGYNNHEPRRMRKLLLSRKEINKLEKKLKDKGLTVVPTKLFIGKSGYAKLNIALAKGKKLHDKRDSIKDRDNKRELDRLKKR